MQPKSKKPFHPAEEWNGDARLFLPSTVLTASGSRGREEFLILDFRFLIAGISLNPATIEIKNLKSKIPHLSALGLPRKLFDFQT